MNRKGFWQNDEKDKDIVEWIANKIQINKLGIHHF
jgi:hypothetical protein